MSQNGFKNDKMIQNGPKSSRIDRNDKQNGNKWKTMGQK